MPDYPSVSPTNSPEEAKILAYILEEEAESTAEDAIPFVGWALNLASITSTQVQLAKTTAQVTGSPRVMSVTIQRTHGIEVTIERDPDDFEFPATATHYEVFLEFSNSKIIRRRIELPSTTVSDPLTVLFENVPLGGMVKVVTYFYSDTDWIAGKAERAGISNVDDPGAGKLSVHLTLEERLVPLSQSTLYSHKERLVIESDHYQWRAGSAPTATKADLRSTQTEGSLASLGIASVNQTLGRLSYGWQGYSGDRLTCSESSNVLGYSYRTIGLGQNPEEGLKSAPCYEAAPSIVSNELFTTDRGIGDNLLISPFGSSQYVVQSFPLDTTPEYEPAGVANINSSLIKVLGILPVRLDDIRLFPERILIGISRSQKKIYRLPLTAQPVDVSLAPEASALSGPALSQEGAQANPALLLAPRALAIGLDQAVVILEVDSSIGGSGGLLRAFNANGVPIRYFNDGTSQAVGLQPLGVPVTYLSIDIEQKGYIYVLGYQDRGLSVDNYFVQIYKPDGSFLTQTNGIAAASMSLDAWRNIYTLNYESVVGDDNAVEPSVSQWIPSTPQGEERDR